MPRRQFVATVLSTMLQNPARFVEDIEDNVELGADWPHERANAMAKGARENGYLVVPYYGRRADGSDLPGGGIVLSARHIGAILYSVEYVPNSEGGNA